MVLGVVLVRFPVSVVLDLTKLDSMKSPKIAIDTKIKIMMTENRRVSADRNFLSYSSLDLIFEPV